MQLLTRTIITSVVFNLTMAGFVFAQQSTREKPTTYIISGSVDVPGVVMRGLPGDPVSKWGGHYSTAVQQGWSGTVTPQQKGFTFMPPGRTYTKVTGDLINQDYAPNPPPPNPNAQRARGQFEGMYGGGSAGAATRRRGRSTGYGGMAVGPVGGRKVLVVPAEQIKPEELAAITEDMQIMSYILDERFKETRRIQGVFTDFGDFFGRDNRQTEATYIQGYGVLFSMEVNFSFSPAPSQQSEQSAEPNEQVDSTWQRARAEVLQPGTPQSASPAPTQEQGRQMVDELKSDLIATLKHAANIRGLQPDQWIILTVIGTGRSFGGMGGMGMGMMGGMEGGSYSTGGGYGGGMAAGGVSTAGGMGGGFASSGFSGGFGAGTRMGGTGGFSGTPSDAATVLTIRAKKADVDAFAQAELTLDQFRKKVKVLMY
jgi:hypothetical protein